jgi:hypothetical protein
MRLARHVVRRHVQLSRPSFPNVLGRNVRAFLYIRILWLSNLLLSLLPRLLPRLLLPNLLLNLLPNLLLNLLPSLLFGPLQTRHYLYSALSHLLPSQMRLFRELILAVYALLGPRLTQGV